MREGLVTWFERGVAVPARMPSPFAPGPPHPLARAAAERLVGELAAAELSLANGKMFGVLVVAAPDGRVGFVRGFSGMLGGSWRVEGFVPPVFDEAAREAFWPAGEAELVALEAAVVALEAGEGATVAAEAAALAARHAAERAELAAAHRARRAARQAARAAGATGAALRELEQQSRGDYAEARRLRAAQAQAAAVVAAAGERVAARRREMVEAMRARSNQLLARLWSGYRLQNWASESRTLLEVCAPEVPRGGTGDCAAPKLLAWAAGAGLRPVALAELWWGPPPATGGRHEGVFYPACRGKCGAILPFMLRGVDVEEAPLHGADGGGVDASEPRVVWEDEELVVVDKPVGLLSVPGRGKSLQDSVATRLAARGGGQALIVHRLDLDVSGLMVVAKGREAHGVLQAQFARREVEKVYVAWVEGSVRGEEGRIELALRVDVDDRPRQVVDAVHGKAAVTEWRVIEREGGGGRTRVELRPRTGRTHQLRVHAAHPAGLGAPIVGDRLYGRGAGAGERLMLHAERIAFRHPRSGERVEVVSRAPFDVDD